MSIWRQRTAVLLKGYFHQDGPGAALGIAWDGGESRQECHGLADIQANLPITARTAFDLASVTKVFTAAAVLLLEERGRLHTEDPVGRHLPGLTDPQRRPVTVRDLLWHTSGLPDYLTMDTEGDAIPLVPDTVREKAREWVRLASPGQSHEYSNTNYFLLAEVIAAASGDSYGEFVHRHLFETFGLLDTFVLGGPHRGALRARGYQNLGFGQPRFEISELDLSILGDGGLFSSIEDLLRWQELFYNGSILGQAALAKALSPGRLDDGTAFDYGCGLMVESLGDKGTWCGHTGGWFGAATYIGRFVEERLSVVVLANEQLAPVVRIAQQSLADWLA